MKKTLLATMLFSICVFESSAQHTGIVYDPDSKPVEFANVTLHAPSDTSLIIGTMTDLEGRFSIDCPVQEVIVRVNFPGYSPLQKLVSDKNVGILKLEAAPIDEAVVYANVSKLIVQKVDRIIYNVENDAFARNKTILQLLEQTPRVNINLRDRSISMVGRSGARLMIDGQILSEDEAKSFMASLKAEEIEAIEVIPIPPAKYQSNGDIGLINIKLRRDPSEGLQGDLSLNYDQGIKASWFPGASLNWHKGIWSMRVGASTSLINGVQDSDEAFIYDDRSFNRQVSTDTRLRDYSGNIMMKVTPTSKSEIGIIAEGGYEDNLFSINNISGFSNTGSLVSTIQNSNPTNIRFNGSVYANFNLADNGSALTVTYNNHFRRRVIDDHFLSDDSQIEKNFISSGTNYYRTNSLLTDFIVPLSIMRLEMGLSAQAVNNDSALGLSGDEINNSMDGCLHYEYNEQIYSAYMSASMQIASSIFTKAGLRYEYTSILGKAINTDEQADQNYHNLFPTVFAIWNINQKNSLSINYARRIQRPFFEDLNPFRRYYDINNYHSGNPNLKPAISDNMELNYSLMGNLNITLWGNLLHNNIDYVPLILEDGTQTQQVLNCSDTRKGGLSVSYNFSPVDWFSIFAQGNAYYSHSHCFLPELNIEDAEGWGGSYNLYANIFMNRKKTLRGGISYWQSLPSVENLTRTAGVAALGIDISYSLLQDRLNLSIGANDIFNQNISKSTRQYSDYKYTSSTNSYQRSIWIGLNWKFGKRTVNDVNIDTKDVIGNRGL